MQHIDPVEKARRDVRVALEYTNEKLKALRATGASDRIRHTDCGLDLPFAKTLASGEKPLKIHPK